MRQAEALRQTHSEFRTLSATHARDDRSGSSLRAETVAAHRRAVERVITHARERLCEPISLHDMSRVAYISPFHFNRVFHEITGLPPAKFVSAMRLEEAKRLLLNTHLSITDICYEVGYNSLGTFTRRFTELVGLGPREFRYLAERITPGSVKSLCAHYAERSGRATPRGSGEGVVGFVDGGDGLVDGVVGGVGSFVGGALLADGVGGRVDGVGGFVDSPKRRAASILPAAGPIFVGLFPAHIPQSRPVGGVLLTSPGAFRIGPVPDGTYHLLGAALPRAADTLGYLLPDPANLSVGAGNGPVIVREGRATTLCYISLRPMTVTDPPLLISLPFLLAETLK